MLGSNGSTLTVTAYTVNDGNGGADYTVTTHTATGTITPAALSISAVTDSKVYDSTTASSKTPTVSGLQGSDTVTGLSEAFTSRNVLGTNASTLAVTAYTVNDGNGGADYTVTTHTASGTITPFTLTVSDITANNKVYDGTMNATLNTSGATLSAIFGGDTVNLLAVPGTFASPNVGNNIAVTVSGLTLSGAQAGDYQLPTPQETTTADILTAAASDFVINAPSSVTAGQGFTFTVTARTASGMTATGYTGTVTFGSPDSASFSPTSYTFVPGDNGTHTFSTTAAILFNPGSNQTITATDTVHSITGTSNNITVLASSGGN